MSYGTGFRRRMLHGVLKLEGRVEWICSVLLNECRRERNTYTDPPFHYFPATLRNRTVTANEPRVKRIHMNCCCT